MSAHEENTSEASRARDHRDFPRLHVEAKVRIAETAPNDESLDQPAVVSDLSLGGARLTTPADLEVGQRIRLVPFSGLLENHPLHKILEFDVVWAGSEPETQVGEQAHWREYGLLHQGSVLDVLNSWLGHLLLRRRGESEIVAQRREHRRVHFEGDSEQPVRATLSHDSRSFDLTLLDIAPGGLLARGNTDEIPVGVHLELRSSWDDSESDGDVTALLGCVVDAHSHSGSTFYRVAFDPDSDLDDEQLVNWAQSVGGQFDT